MELSRINATILNCPLGQSGARGIPSRHTTIIRPEVVDHVVLDQGVGCQWWSRPTQSCLIGQVSAVVVAFASCTYCTTNGELN